MAKSKQHAKRVAKLKQRNKRLQAEIKRQDRIMRTFSVIA